LSTAAIVVSSPPSSDRTLSMPLSSAYRPTSAECSRETRACLCARREAIVSAVPIAGAVRRTAAPAAASAVRWRLCRGHRKAGRRYHRTDEKLLLVATGLTHFGANYGSACGCGRPWSLVGCRTCDVPDPPGAPARLSPTRVQRAIVPPRAARCARLRVSVPRRSARLWRSDRVEARRGAAGAPRHPLTRRSAREVDR